MPMLYILYRVFGKGFARDRHARDHGDGFGRQDQSRLFYIVLIPRAFGSMLAFCRGHGPLTIVMRCHRAGN